MNNKNYIWYDSSVFIINSQRLFTIYLHLFEIFGTFLCTIMCVLNDGGKGMGAVNSRDIVICWWNMFSFIRRGESSFLSFFLKNEFYSPINLGTRGYIFCILFIALLNWKYFKLDFCFLPELPDTVEERTLAETSLLFDLDLIKSLCAEYGGGSDDALFLEANRKGDCKIVIELRMYHTDVNAENKEGCTALMKA